MEAHPLMRHEYNRHEDEPDPPQNTVDIAASDSDGGGVEETTADEGKPREEEKAFMRRLDRILMFVTSLARARAYVPQV